MTAADEPWPMSSSALSEQQIARVQALRQARIVLVPTTAISTGKADPIDLVSVASWIVTGDDPWPTPAVAAAPDEARWKGRAA